MPCWYAEITVTLEAKKMELKQKLQFGTMEHSSILKHLLSIKVRHQMPKKHLHYRQNGRSLVRIFWKYSQCPENVKESQVSSSKRWKSRSLTE